ncbi:MAG: ribosomal protein S18-alanine N-acetyltransferase [Acidobacteriota bacterium]|nr:ribosomal protein S18-alanine N-acetyltransferase [Acidobacteriota bacterium]
MTALQPRIDPDAFAGVEARVFPKPWSAETFVGEPGRLGYGLWDGSRCVGYIYGSVVMDEAELWRIAILSEYRRRGLAAKLLRAFANGCRTLGAATVYLEVSALNRPALAFYIQSGFTEQGRRPNYYGAGDDALLLSLDLSEYPD